MNSILTKIEAALRKQNDLLKRELTISEVLSITLESWTSEITVIVTDRK